MAVEFTVTGVLRATKYPLGPTPAKVSVRLIVDGHTDSSADIPVPDEALEALYEHMRDVATTRMLTHGDGGTVTVRVTIDGN